MQQNGIERPKPTHIRPSKKLPIVIKWGDKHIHLGESEFLGDESLVFEANLSGDDGSHEAMQFGTSNLKDGKFFNKPPDTSVPIGSGVHITLHPPTSEKPGVMHFREHYPGSILERRAINWHPVTTPFNLLHIFTRPIDAMPETQKQQTVMTPVDPDYKDSLEIVVDVFPRDTVSHYPIQGSVEVWGVCPGYLVRVSIGLTGERLPGFIYWPIDSNLEL